MLKIEKFNDIHRRDGLARKNNFDQLPIRAVNRTAGFKITNNTLMCVMTFGKTKTSIAGSRHREANKSEWNVKERSMKKF